MKEKIIKLLFSDEEIDETETRFQNKVYSACFLVMVVLFAIIQILNEEDTRMVAASTIVLSFAILQFLISQTYHSKHKKLWICLTILPIAAIAACFIRILFY